MAVLSRLRTGTIIAGLAVIVVVLLDPGGSQDLRGTNTFALVGDTPVCFEPEDIDNKTIGPPDPNAARQYLFTRFSKIPSSDQRRKIESKSNHRTRFLVSHGSNSYTVSILTDKFRDDLYNLKNGNPETDCIADLVSSNRSSGRFDGPRDDLPGFDPNDGDPSTGALITVYVRFFDNVPIAEQRQILDDNGVFNVDQLESFDGQWRVTLRNDNLNNLRDNRQIQWVENLEQPPADDMDEAKPAISLPNDYANRGDGTVIAQWEICHPASEVPEEHPDLANRASTGFASRVCSGAPSASSAPSYLPNNSHATQVAGIMIGDGSAGEVDGELRGIAPRSQLVSYSVASQDTYGFVSEYLDAARRGAIISSNSWGPTVDDYYHRLLYHEYPFRSAFFDLVSSLRNSGGRPAGPGHRMLIVASSGNRGADKVDPNDPNSAWFYWETTRVRNAAKNVLTVGNVASGRGDAANWPAFDSGRGPTRDGRIKPDLVAPGSEVEYGGALTDDGISAPVYPTGLVQPQPRDFYRSSWGTSFSTPIVSGAAALLATTIREGSCGRNPTPAELRALLINTAKDLTDASSEASRSDLVQQQLTAQHALAELEDQVFGPNPEPVPRNSPLVFDKPPAGVDALVGPDYVFGYGLVQPSKADMFAQGGHFLRGLLDRGFIEYPIHVNQSDLDDDGMLRVTLAWDDPPFAYNSPPDPDTGLLQNDLDLVLIGPYGRRYFPWKLDPKNPADAATQATRDRLIPWTGKVGDHRNTVEQVAIEPEESQLAKTWKIRVYGSTMRLPPQEFALVSSIISPAVPCDEIAMRVVDEPVTPPKTRTFWMLFIIALVILLLLLLWLAEKIYDAYILQGQRVAVTRIIQAYVVLLLIATAIFYWSDALMGAL